MLNRILDAPLGRRSVPRTRGSLGLLERWYAAQRVPRVAAVALELARPLERLTLERALRAVQRRHGGPLLATLDLGVSRAPAWGVAATGALPWHFSHERIWTRLAEEAIHSPFTAGELLWRVHVAEDRRSLVASFHHVLADGVSAHLFAEDLARALCGEPLEPLHDDGSPLETRLDLRPTPRLLLRESGVWPRQAAPGFYAGGEHQGQSLRTSLHAATIEADTAACILERARAAHTTVHGALCAAALVASAQHARRWPLPARLVSPVSLRRLCEPRPDGLGVFLCGVESHHDVRADTHFWALARGCKSALVRGLPEAIRRPGLLAWTNIERLAIRAATTRPNGRTATVEVSNLARVPWLGAGMRAWFCQGNHYHGPLFSLSALACADAGDMRLCLAVPSPLVSSHEADRWLCNVTRVLARVSTHPDLTLEQALRCE